jgi:excisionase family DNA binding protein
MTQGSTILLSALSVEDLLLRIQEATRTAVQEELQKQHNEKLLSPKEVCELFSPKISRQTLHNYTKKGLIRSSMLGSSVRYKYSEVMEAVKSIRRYK